MFVDPPAVAAQALGDVFGRVVEGAVRVCRLALAAQAQAPSGMQVDVAGEEAARPAEGDLRLQRMIEVFPGDSLQMAATPDGASASDRSSCLPETVISIHASPPSLEAPAP